MAHNLNLTIPFVESKALMYRLRGKLSFSAGSACSTLKVEPSYVLKAIGLSEAEIYQTIRLGLGRDTAAGNIADLLIDAIEGIRSECS